MVVICPLLSPNTEPIFRNVFPGTGLSVNKLAKVERTPVDSSASYQLGHSHRRGLIGLTWLTDCVHFDIIHSS